MGAPGDLVIPLAAAAAAGEGLVGGKAAVLGRLRQSGWRVPDGFVVTTESYAQFVAGAGLESVIRMELGRKSLDAMRWEEIWDAALRLRGAFLAAELPAPLATAIGAAVADLGGETELAVRSSAPGEDARDTSFAGLHESVVGVRGTRAVLDAVRIVWASLWSDAALLYRRELALDPARSRMAVLVQRLEVADRSGVAFARDPRAPARDAMVIEAVPGLCRDLVDGRVDPDRWLLRRQSGEVVELRLGERDVVDEPGPLLGTGDLEALRHAVLSLEDQLGWPPDVEWTGRGDRFTVLQARPITEPRAAADSDAADRRPWYLSLRPGEQQLRQLCRRVADELIPALVAEGEQLAAARLEDLENHELAAAIDARDATLRHWRGVYWRDFIPFAHGVRRLATYYNDSVRPDDPYEFVGLLTGEDRLASRRNRALSELAALVREDPLLASSLAPFTEDPPPSSDFRSRLTTALAVTERGAAFAARFARVLDLDLDITVAGERLADHPGESLRVVLELAAQPPSRRDTDGPAATTPGQLEDRLLAAVGESRQSEAREVLAIARLSWRLRDDDNLLIGRLESQLLRALQLAATRLQAVGRLAVAARPSPEHATQLARALDGSGAEPVSLPATSPPADEDPGRQDGVSARQLTGQPGAPGIASGPARWIRRLADLAAFRPGDVLVCDAVQPNFTQLVPLACAVVERRGGMLIHGVIIARELGLPCVNGIPGLLDRVRDGDRLTVDGYLGIVTVGEPELDLERADA